MADQAGTQLVDSSSMIGVASYIAAYIMGNPRIMLFPDLRRITDE